MVSATIRRDERTSSIIGNSMSQADIPLLLGYLRAACANAWGFGFHWGSAPCCKLGIMMSNVLKAPALTGDGVAFSVLVEYKFHECLVSPEALSNLSQSVDKELDLIATYSAYEAKITGVARRLVMAGVNSTPILLGPQNFR
jgi:hypothetical protein